MKRFLWLFLLTLTWTVDAATTVSFSNITLTNTVKTNDLLLVDSALGGTNYSTVTATKATVLGSNLIGWSGIPASSAGVQGVLGNVYQSTNGTLTSLSTNTITGTGTIVLSSGIPASDNWSASGTTNSSLVGNGYLNTLTATNGVTIGSAGTLFGDASNTLALRNGTAAQTFKVYYEYVDPSNNGGVQINYVGNYPQIIPFKNGSTAIGGLVLGSQSLPTYLDGNSINLRGGHLLFGTDNTYDIGASGANRPRNVYAVGTAFANGGFVTDQNGGLTWSLRGSIYCRNDGIHTLYDANGTGYNRLQFGGTTSSFPSIKRNGTALEARLADDSNYSPLNAPWQQSGYTKVLTSTTAADFLYVAVPNTNMIGGRVLYTVSATDGTDAQQITGTCQFGAVGKGTAVTANITDVQNTSTVSAGTLTAVLAKNVATNNVFALGLTATTSLTTTNLVVRWRLETPSTFQVNAL